MPASLWFDRDAAALRQLLLDECTWEWLYGFENRNKLFAIDSRYRFAILVGSKGGSTSVYVRCAVDSDDGSSPEEGDGAALNHLMNAVRLRPNDPEIRDLIAAILRKQGRAKEAVDHLRAVVSLKPREIQPVVNLATCMRDANQFDECRAVCDAALQMVPNHSGFKQILESLPPPKAEQN